MRSSIRRGVFMLGALALAAGATQALANDCVVRLKGAVDPELLRIAIHAAGRLGGDGRGGD